MIGPTDVCGHGGPKPVPAGWYALVSYIPGRLGEYFDALRQELEPGCTAQSHLTVLPPRPLKVDESQAEKECKTRIAQFAPVNIAIARIHVFAQTSVIFAEVGDGADALQHMHQHLNSNGLAYCEPYRYHPHITLAQSVSPDNMDEAFKLAVHRWKEYGGKPGFVLDRLTFVQNTERCGWLDLAHCDLAGSPSL